MKITHGGYSSTEANDFLVPFQNDEVICINSTEEDVCRARLAICFRSNFF